jgi:hypothetical protein
MIEASKAHYTVSTAFAELQILARVYRRAKRGYRAALWGLMGRGSRIIARLNQSEDLRRQFVLRVKRDNPHRNGGQPVNIATEVMAIIAGAKTRSARQTAWKRGCVLDFLTGCGVRADNVAKEIEKRGGIERIYQASIAKQSALQKRPRARSGLRPLAAKRGNAQADISAAKTNNGEILCGVYMNLADRDAILGRPNGSRVRLNTIKIGQPSADLKVRSIKIIR